MTTNTILETEYILPLTYLNNGLIAGEWTNPSYLLLQDDLVAESSPSQGASCDVMVGNFNFAIPVGAVITGIKFKVRGYVGAVTVPPATLTFNAVNNLSGTIEYYPYTAPFDAFTQSMDEYEFGSSNYLFNRAWTVDEINNFKLQLIGAGDIFIDDVQAQVFYYIPSVTPDPDPTTNTCLTCESQIQGVEYFLALEMLRTDTKAYVYNFNYADGTPIQIADLGDCGGTIDIVVDEGKINENGNNFMEDMRITDITRLPSGLVELDLGTINNRGLGFKTPYTHDTNLLSPHSVNAKLIISNDAPFYDKLLKKCQADILFSKPIIVEDEGVVETPHVHNMNFLGGGVTVSVPDPVGAPDDVEIVIPGAGGTTPPKRVAVGSYTSGNVQVSTATFTLDFSGVDRGAIIQISTEQLRTVTSVTVGGVSAVQEVALTHVGGNLRHESWSVVGVPSGTQDVVIVLSGAAYLCAGAESFVGVNQTTPVGATQSATGSSNDVLEVLTTTVDNSIVVDGLVTAMTPILYTPYAGQVENWHHTANSDTRQGGSSYQLAGTFPDAVTMRWSITQSTRWVCTAVELLGITSASPTGITLKTNGVNNGSQTILNLKNGTGITVVDDGVGGVTINATGGGSGGSGGSTQIDQTPDNGTYGLLIGDVDGVNTQYQVSLGLYLTGKLIVYLNGLAQLQGVSDDWIETDPATGLFDFNTPPVVNDIITVEYETATGSTGQSLTLTVSQTAHGLSVGDVIKSNGVANQYSKAKADSGVNAEVVGIVITVINVDSFVYSKDIMGYSGAGIPAGTPGEAIFLSPSVAGAMTMTEPTAGGQISKPIGVLIASAAKMNFTSDYRGQDVQATIAGPYSSGVVLGSGSIQNIPHGLGITPTHIRITALMNATSGVAVTMSVGTYDGVNNANTQFGTATGISTTNIIDLHSTSANDHSAVATFDATDIILTWTGGGAGSLLWEAYA